MLVLFGDPALSAFRIDSLLSQCREKNLAVNSVNTQYVYLIQTDSGTDDDKVIVISSLSGIIGYR